MTAQGVILTSTFGGQTINFNNVPLGQTSSKSFTVNNTGNVTPGTLTGDMTAAVDTAREALTRLVAGTGLVITENAGEFVSSFIVEVCGNFDRETLARSAAAFRSAILESCQSAPLIESRLGYCAGRVAFCRLERRARRAQRTN